jgi:aminoglycoside phosphotransferase (APT) family kinase protein
MNMTAAARAWLASATGIAPDRLALAPLAGATSSSVLLVRSEASGERFVLRVLDNPAWLAEEPDLAEHEQAALMEAARAGLPAPQPLAIATGDAGFGTPSVLMTFIGGAVVLREGDGGHWLQGLAVQLAAIHRHPAADFPWRFQSWVDASALAVPAWSAQPRVWQRAIERWRQGPPAERAVFLHRDYHPANVLWQRGAVSGVVDWVNACRGPAGVDVAHCRANLALMYGAAVAKRFLDAYAAAAPGYRHDPYWDIDAILDMCLPEPGYYPPWREFGLAAIAPALLRERIDALLGQALARC